MILLLRCIKCCMVFMVCLSLLIVTPSFTSASSEAEYNPDVGIWYSTWYAKHGNYFYARSMGGTSSKQFLEDVNGDGLDDAVVYYASTGNWEVALSDGTQFMPSSIWISGHGVGSTEQLMGDVNGDGKADSVVCFSNGAWWVSLSSGSGFLGYTLWNTNYTNYGTAYFLADVNGDSKADAVAYQNGEWRVSLSTGTAFASSSIWVQGHATNSNNQMLGDMNGDGKADAVAFYSSNGTWVVSLSSGTSFQVSTVWITGHGANSNKQMLGRVGNGNKCSAIAVYVDSSTVGNWYVAHVNDSNTGFGSTGTWKLKHGMNSFNQLVGNVTNDGIDVPVCIYATGQWSVLPTQYFKPNMYNTWEGGLTPDGREIKYKPYTLGQYQTYDSGNIQVIDEHIQMLVNAGINFILFDLTNGLDIDGGYILNNAKTVASRIAVWNNAHPTSKLKYAVGIGLMQLTHTPVTMEEECERITNEFVNNSTYGGSGNYYYRNGKPLIVSYAEYADRITWQNWTESKARSNVYTVRWMQGRVPDTTVPTSDYGLYFGWTTPQGSLINTDAMVAMPGHNDNRGYDFVSRQYNTVNGGFYSVQCWDRILQTKPQIVIINSFNEYAEETAIQPSDTSGVTGLTEKWYNESGVIDANFYWNKTIQYIQQLRA